MEDIKKLTNRQLLELLAGKAKQDAEKKAIGLFEYKLKLAESKVKRRDREIEELNEEIEEIRVKANKIINELREQSKARLADALEAENTALGYFLSQAIKHLPEDQKNLIEDAKAALAVRGRWQ